MKNALVFILFMLILISACEKDDFCTQNPVTPKMVIKFKNYTNVTKNKKPNSLYVWAKDKDSLYAKTSVDSVFLPLNSLTKQTIYNFSVSKDSISGLTIQYEPKSEFVSRSCGYKIIFNNVKITKKKLPKSWIDSISVKEISTINNQNNAHVTIYH